MLIKYLKGIKISFSLNKVHTFPNSFLKLIIFRHTQVNIFLYKECLAAKINAEMAN